MYVNITLLYNYTTFLRFVLYMKVKWIKMNIVKR